MKNIILLVTMMCFVFMAEAQIKTPQPSPSSTVMQTVGLTDITVEYSRPSMKGRTIFGDLVPYDQVWRTGANASTDVTFSAPVKFGGQEVAAGTYALYSMPGKKEWKMMLYKNADLWGAPQKFEDSLVVATAKATPVYMPDEAVTETFNIGFEGLHNNGADLYLLWENVYVSVPIEVGTQETVQKNIEQVMAGPSANDYYAAARFYFEEDMDSQKAHNWISKATEMNTSAFWMMKLQSEIEAKMGKYDMAIKTAEKAKMMADKAGNAQYVSFNEANIAKWMKMK